MTATLYLHCFGPKHYEQPTTVAFAFVGVAALLYTFFWIKCQLVNILMPKQKAMPSETTYSGTIFWQDQCMRPHPWHLFSVVGGNSPHYAATTVTQLFLKKRCTKNTCVYNVCMTSSCIFRGKKALSKKKLKRRQKVKSKVKARTKVWGLFKTNYVAMLLFIFYVVLSYKTIVGLTLDQLLNK